MSRGIQDTKLLLSIQGSSFCLSAYKTHGTEAGAEALTSLAATSRRVSMTDNTSLMSKFAETPFSGNNKSPPGSWSLQNKDIVTNQQQGAPNSSKIEI